MMFTKRVPRKRSRPPKQKHDIICDRCGARDKVTFSPKGEAPVLCRRCFRLKRRHDRQSRLKKSKEGLE